MSKNRLWASKNKFLASKNTFCNGKIQKNISYPFFLPRNPAIAARNWPDLPLLARAAAPGTRPFWPKTTKIWLRHPKVASGRAKNEWQGE